MYDNHVDAPATVSGFPLPDPVAVDGCPACATHADSIRTARRRGNPSAVTDQRVLMRRHIDREHA
jgi:hypothetical protein